MSILDDAIREHLELKRAHGADSAELKRLEDEAFGPAERPDDPNPFSDAPTEFLAAPATDAAEAAAEARAEPAERRMPNIADLQEGPPPAEPEAAEAEAPEAEAPPETHPEQQTIPVPHPEPVPDEPSDGAAEELPKAGAPNTTEREAIAEQPTEFFDVESNLASGSEQRSPTDEELLASQLAEPRLTPGEPVTEDPVTEDPVDDREDEDEDDFFSDQRLSDELNQALEAPVTDEHEIFPQTDEHATEEPSEEHAAIHDSEEEGEEEDSAEHEDVLEDTPEFLEDAPEDDELWFEQKPPKDFDFDD